MNFLADFAFKLWIASNWEMLLAAALAFVLLMGFNKWLTSFDDNGELSPQEKLKSVAFFIIGFVILVIIFTLMFGYLFR